MFVQNILVIALTWFIILGGQLSTSEWIEMPEFSDNSKVYRLPFNKFERDKISEGHLNAQKYAFPSTNFHDIRKIITTTENSLIKIQLTSVKNDIVLDFPQLMDFNNEKNESTTTYDGFQHDDDDDDDDDDDGLVSDEHDDENTATTENLPSLSEKLPEPEIINKKKGFLIDYLPVELFKQVHKTLLQNQGKSIKGKIEFLRSFEDTLLGEIESRLAVLVTPTRVKRGSGWDDDHVGFPSVEGALLAISFLTFAVYLVQLVMMLFRNLANNPPPPNTVLVNRNRRSIESQRSSITEETVRILQYIEEFSIKHKRRH